MNTILKSTKETILALSLIFPLWLFYSFQLDNLIALKGFSPLTWINQLNHPSNFLHNFPSGVEQFSKSLFMQLYIPLFQLWGETLPIKAVIFLELFLTFIAMRNIASLLGTENNRKILTILFFSVYAFSYSRNINWGRWSHPFYVGQFYVFADLARVMAFFYLIKKRSYLSLLLLSISVFIHPTIGLYGAMFICTYLLFMNLPLKEKTNYYLTTFFILVLNYLIINILFREKNLENMSSLDWILFGKMFSSHLFPVQFGFFAKYFYLNFYPSLVFIFLLITIFLKFPTIESLNNRDFLISSAFVGTIVLSGIIISYYESSVFIIKMALPRASEIVISIGSIIIFKTIYDTYSERDKWWERGTLLIFIFSFFLKELSWNIVIVALTLYILTRNSSGKISYIPFVFTLIFFSAFQVYKVLGFNSHFHKWVHSDYLFLTLILVLIFVSPLVKLNKNIILISSLILGGISFGFQNMPNKELVITSHSFKEAQIWARGNTAKNALFLVDPTIFYGWREFSERSSFGSVREWLHTSWLYNESQQNFEEGLKRANEFIDPKNFIQNMDTINSDTGRKYIQEVKNRFYEGDILFIKSLVKKYGIDFIVASKAYGVIFPGSLVFENKHFIIFDARSLK